MQACAPSSKFSLLVVCFWDQSLPGEDVERYYRAHHWEVHRRLHFVRRDRAPPDVVGKARAGDYPAAAIRINWKLARSIVSESDLLDLHLSFKY